MALLAAMLLAVPAQAAGPLSIESFSVGSSNTEAGAHPDVTTHITMSNPGEPEAAQNVGDQLPRGPLRQPAGDLGLPLGRLRAEPVPRLLAGRHHHDLRELRIQPGLPAGDRAPLQHGGPRGVRDGSVRFRRADGGSAGQRPDHGPHRLRLRTADDRHRDHPGNPVRRRRHHGLGLPGRCGTRHRQIPRRRERLRRHRQPPAASCLRT